MKNAINQWNWFLTKKEWTEKFGDVPKKESNKHNIKVNIRKDSIFEIFKTDIRILYYLLFYNFVDNKSVKISFINAQEFSKMLKIEYITRK